MAAPGAGADIAGLTLGVAGQRLALDLVHDALSTFFQAPRPPPGAEVAASAAEHARRP